MFWFFCRKWSETVADSLLYKYIQAKSLLQIQAFYRSLKRFHTALLTHSSVVSLCSSFMSSLPLHVALPSNYAANSQHHRTACRHTVAFLFSAANQIIKVGESCTLKNENYNNKDTGDASNNNNYQPPLCERHYRDYDVNRSKKKKKTSG